jgi:UPF0755 protein
VSDVDLGPLDEHEPPRRFRWVPGCIAVLLALAVLVGGAAFVVVRGGDWVSGLFASSAPDYSGEGRGSVVIEVRDGDTAAQIGTELAKADVVKSEAAFNEAALADERSREIQVGFYRLPRRIPAATALTTLLDPQSRVGRTVTVPEGLRVSEVIDVLAAGTRFSTRSFTAVLERPNRLPLPPYAGGKAEGYLFPATYEVQPNTSAADLLTAMVQRFDQAASDVELTSRARALDISPGQAVTVASLVQAEASRTQDMPKVARVIYNRLEMGEPLGLDSTVHYAVNSSGDIFTTRRERGVDSPYNTYARVGLPPGPIDSPGEEAMRAALYPAQGSWIYFVTVNLNTGETRFATTAAQHEVNRGVLASWCTAHIGRC